MSRLQTPLRHQILWSTGDLILRAYLDLLLKDGAGNWHPKTFRVDSASDVATVPAYHAARPECCPYHAPLFPSRTIWGCGQGAPDIRRGTRGATGTPRVFDS